jgi:hypothetical protein
MCFSDTWLPNQSLEPLRDGRFRSALAVDIPLRRRYFSLLGETIVIIPTWQHRLAVEAREWTCDYGPLRVWFRVDDHWHWDLLSILSLVLWVCGSGYLMLHVWRAHPLDGFPKKLVWTIILVLPLVGWLLYGQLYGESRNQKVG